VVLADNQHDVGAALDGLEARGGERGADGVDRADALGPADHRPGVRHRDEDSQAEQSRADDVLDQPESPGGMKSGRHAQPPSLLAFGKGPTGLVRTSSQTKAAGAAKLLAERSIKGQG